MNVSFDEEKENNSCCDFDLYNQPPFSRNCTILLDFYNYFITIVIIQTLFFRSSSSSSRTAALLEETISSGFGF
jgi:hypothetical protein